MSFNLSGKALLNSITINRGTGDESDVKIQLKVDIENVSSSVLAGPFGAETPEELERAFARDEASDVERAPRFLGIKALESNTKYEEKHELKIARQRPIPVKSVTKITAQYRGRKLWDVSCQVNISSPPQGLVELLAERLHLEVPIELTQFAELDLQGGGRNDKPKQGDLVDAAGATPITKGKRGPKPGGKAKPAKATKRATKKSAKKAA